MKARNNSFSLVFELNTELLCLRGLGGLGGLGEIKIKITLIKLSHGLYTLEH